jgi:hypothetical protein
LLVGRVEHKNKHLTVGAGEHRVNRATAGALGQQFGRDTARKAKVTHRVHKTARVRLAIGHRRILKQNLRLVAHGRSGDGRVGTQTNNNKVLKHRTDRELIESRNAFLLPQTRLWRVGERLATTLHDSQHFLVSLRTEHGQLRTHRRSAGRRDELNLFVVVIDVCVFAPIAIGDGFF